MDKAGGMVRLACGHYADNDSCDDDACQGAVNMDWLLGFSSVGDPHDTERSDEYRRSKALTWSLNLRPFFLFIGSAHVFAGLYVDVTVGVVDSYPADKRIVIADATFEFTEEKPG